MNGRPGYSTVYDRFTELEPLWPEFQVTVSELVQLGRKATGGLLGRVAVGGFAFVGRPSLLDGRETGGIDAPGGLHKPETPILPGSSDFPELEPELNEWSVPGSNR